MNKWLQIFEKHMRLDKDKASNKDIYEMILEASNIHGTNMLILMLAIFIASIGLNMNSTATIIGAMLISPLMGGIMAIGYGMATRDLKLIKKATKGLFIQIVICILTSTLYFKLSPVTRAQSELLARTTPTIWDVLIAIFGGIAGIVGVTRKEKSNVIPGVAIATALMPPLCTVGYGLARWDPKFFIGAFYLFFINGFFISLSTYLIIRLMGIPPKKFMDVNGVVREEKTRISIIIIAIITIIPSLFLGYQLVTSSMIDTNVSKFIDNELHFNHTQVVSHYVDKQNNKLELALVGTPLSNDEINTLQSKLSQYNLGEMTLDIVQGNSSAVMQSSDLVGILNDKLYPNSEFSSKTQNEQVAILAKELIEYRLSDYDVESLTKEICALYPSIEWFTIGKSKIYHSKTQQEKDVILSFIKSSEALTQDDHDKILSWLKTRMNTEDVLLYIQ